jgi:uncharacterized protein YjbJ (UPF0337 family)
MSDPRIDQAKGDVKTVAGQLTNDPDLEAQGRAESATAGLRKQAGDMADKAKDAAGDMADKAGDVAGDMADKAKDVADDVGDKVRDLTR